jgi:protein-tyrosine phosphatase
MGYRDGKLCTTQLLRHDREGSSFIVRPSQLAASVAVGIALAVGTASATPTPAVPRAASAIAQRSLGLQGAVNARDIGGYRTMDGHTVRAGLVFRSNTLAHLTRADLANLQRRDIRVIEDLRTAYERDHDPDVVPADVVEHWNDVLGHAPRTTLAQPQGIYRAFITAPGANLAFGNVLRDIIYTTDSSLLYHCSAGKDRTGWMTAVLLTILGVDHATVLRDYLLSNVYLHDPTAVGPVMLDTAFGTANQVYGSFNNYVHQGLRLSDMDVAALKLKLLI